jgi:hypothetical protein
MVTIFHVPDARSLRVLWRLEEMGVKADVTSLPFPPRRLRPDYLSVIPAGPCRDVETAAKLIVGNVQNHHLRTAGCRTILLAPDRASSEKRG